MVIKKYVASNINEALRKIRVELGKDAVIINQRKIREPGIKGYFKKKVLEVTVAVQSKEKPLEKKDNYNNDFTNKENSNSEKEKLLIDAILKSKLSEKLQQENNNKNSKETKVTYDVKKEFETIDRKNENKIYEEVLEMKGILNSLLENNKKEKDEEEEKNEEKEIINLLEENDISKELINYLLNMTKDEKDQKMRINKIKTLIKAMINIQIDNEEKNMIFVGPTGVGKTTTIAKVAGKLALIDKKNIGLITIDTYRIGAVEQLKTYAEIMNIPFKVALNLKDMDKCLEEMKDCEIILIDTTGRSSKNTMQLSELRAYIDKIKNKKISLVVSATTKNKDIKIISDAYKTLNFDNVIVTKLDETSTYGSIINILQEVKVPLSFITTGQSVPEDIKIPDKDEIIKLVLGESTLC